MKKPYIKMQGLMKYFSLKIRWLIFCQLILYLSDKLGGCHSHGLSQSKDNNKTGGSFSRFNPDNVDSLKTCLICKSLLS